MVRSAKVLGYNNTNCTVNSVNKVLYIAINTPTATLLIHTYSLGMTVLLAGMYFYTKSSGPARNT